MLNGIINLKVLLLACLLIIARFSRVAAQEYVDNIKDVLMESGFENIRVDFDEDKYFISYENNKYRWDVKALSSLLDSVSKKLPFDAELNIYHLKYNIPQFVTKVNTGDWLDYRYDSIGEEMDSLIYVSRRTGEGWHRLKKIHPDEPGIFKYDIVLYPQFYLANIGFLKIYEIQLNVAPALEVSFWKGMLLTAQVIFPLINDFEPEGDLIRPGFLVLSQNFRLSAPLFGKVSIGNFNNHRYGIDISLKYIFKNENWTMSMSTGLTGYSEFSESYWYRGSLDTYTFSVTAGYFYPQASLQVNLSGGRFIYGDYGARIDITRYFGETTLGFYGVFTESRPNGGFHFSFPFPPRKRWKRRTFRVIPPRYFDWEYDAGTAFGYGQYYETRPNENRSEHFFNPNYIKNELLKIN